MTTLLLIVHGLLAVALLGAVTQQAISVLRPRRAVGRSFVGRTRAVSGPAYVTAIIVLSVNLWAWNSAWGGGDADDHDHADDGLRFFGFVKDTAGRTIRDAKVTAEIQGLGQVIARTDATGVYKLPGFGKDITPNRVSISCSKEGYKQTRTFNRTSPTKKPVTAIEIECTMQRVGGK
jgi:hypothetical protein